MTAPLYRRVVGYPFPVIMGGYVAMTKDQSAVFTLDAGPGECIGVTFWSSGSISTLYYNMWCKLVIDGYTIFDTVWRDLVLMPTNYSCHSLFGTNDMQTSDQACSSLKILMSYETSFVMTITNKNTGSMGLVYSFYSRTGC